MSREAKWIEFKLKDEIAILKTLGDFERSSSSDNSGKKELQDNESMEGDKDFEDMAFFKDSTEKER